MSIAGSFTGRDITPGRDLFGFKVLAGGGRYSDGAFLHFGESAPFWSATEYDAVWSWERDLNYVDGTNQGRNYYFSFKPYGYSLRCIQD